MGSTQKRESLELTTVCLLKYQMMLWRMWLFQSLCFCFFLNKDNHTHLAVLGRGGGKGHSQRYLALQCSSDGSVLRPLQGYPRVLRGKAGRCSLQACTCQAVFYPFGSHPQCLGVWIWFWFACLNVRKSCTNLKIWNMEGLLLICLKNIITARQTLRILFVVLAEFEFIAPVSFISSQEAERKK